MPELHDVFQMVADADIILNLGHISFQEMKKIVPAAKRQGIKRIVCDHPFFSHLSVAQQVELADHGVWINFTAGELFPRWWRVSIAEFAAAIRNVGVKRPLSPATADNCIILRSSRHSGSPVNCSSKRNLRLTKSS